MKFFSPSGNRKYDSARSNVARSVAMSRSDRSLIWTRPGWKATVLLVGASLTPGGESIAGDHCDAKRPRSPKQRMPERVVRGAEWHAKEDPAHIVVRNSRLAGELWRLAAYSGSRALRRVGKIDDVALPLLL